MIDILTDDTFLWGTQKAIQLMLRHSMTVYQYMLTYQGASVAHPGVSHEDELVYLFDPIAPPYNHTAPLPTKDLEVSKFMTNAWVNFAKMGNPNTPGMMHQQWKKCTDGEYPIPYLNISGPEPTMDASEEVGYRVKFWESLL